MRRAWGVDILFWEIRMVTGEFVLNYNNNGFK